MSLLLLFESHKTGSGFGPLPFVVGVPPLIGRVFGPLPFVVGVPPLIGKGFGPLPFMLGYVATVTGGGGYIEPYDIYGQARQEDEMLLELLASIMPILN